ncbi:MAG: hypothetical protein ACOVOT_02990 [Rubrivivax sp.]|jgi:hypothetical protein|nr:hypothetical protein [Rubrivivax sp.]
MKHPSQSASQRLKVGLLGFGLAGLACAANAATLDEAVVGDFSGSGLAPTLFSLDAAVGDNVLSGQVGRIAGVVDRDYVHVLVPAGYLWTGMFVGNTTVGGGGGSAFIGLADGALTAVPPSASDASGLLGWKLYGASDRGTDILDDMAIPSFGSSGFTVPLAAGSYTLWIQELATGSFPYSFNLTVSAVPELPTALTMLLGLGVAAGWLRRRGPQRGGATELGTGN